MWGGSSCPILLEAVRARSLHPTLGLRWPPPGLILWPAPRTIHPAGKASVLKCKRNRVTSLPRAFRGLPREFRIKSNLPIVLGKRALPCMAPASPLPTRHAIPAKPGYTWSLNFCRSVYTSCSPQLLTRELLLVLEAPDPVSLLSTRLSWPLPNPRQG